MNLAFAAFAFVAAIMFPACSVQNVAGPDSDEQMVTDKDKGAKTPVLVELFTSEGCSSCPPADNLLIMLDRDEPVEGTEIITLGFHVDYWDHGGWKDKFSSAEYTKRQEAYAKQFDSGPTYTPQAVIDGKVEAVGNQDKKVKDAIGSRLSVAKAAISAEITADKIKLDISSIPSKKASTVYIAVAENGLVSDVGGGENGGQRLSHVSVVRDLRTVGTIDGKQTNAKFEMALPINSAWKTDNLRYVIFIQEDSSMRIIGVKKITPQ